MNTYERASSEWLQIVETKFWSEYVRMIREHRDALSRKCETEEDPRKYQGGIKAIDFILGKNEQPGLAERLLAELKEKSN